MKNRDKYIKKITVIAEADINNGNVEKLKKIIERSIEKEDYELCEGIQRAINKPKPK